MALVLSQGTESPEARFINLPVGSTSTVLLALAALIRDHTGPGRQRAFMQQP
jgi:hypothetical protein